MQLQENKLPNKKLLKVRHFTDGGFYREAQHIVQSIQFTELHSLKEQTEYFYRLARLAHKTEEFSVAKIYYEETSNYQKKTHGTSPQMPRFNWVTFIAIKKI